MRENFKPEPNTQMKKTRCNKQHNYIYQYNEAIGKLYNNFFVYFWTLFQHLVQVPSFSNLCWPETHFLQVQGHQRANASTGSINNF